MEATVQELQERVTAMQAALEGNAQSGLFKQALFSGYQTEDVNEWIAKCTAATPRRYLRALFSADRELGNAQHMNWRNQAEK